MALKWTKTALRSIDEIAGFVAKDNSTRATSLVLDWKDAVTKLQVHPEATSRIGDFDGCARLGPNEDAPGTAARARLGAR